MARRCMFELTPMASVTAKRPLWRSDGTPINSTTVSSPSGESSDPGSDTKIDPLEALIPNRQVYSFQRNPQSIPRLNPPIAPRMPFPVLDSGPAVPSPEPVVNETIPAFEPLGGSDPVVPLTPDPEVPSDLSSPQGLPPLEGDSTTFGSPTNDCRTSSIGFHASFTFVRIVSFFAWNPK